MHTGRIGHVANLPKDVRPVGASGIPAAGKMHTDSSGDQDYSVPVALTSYGVQKVIASYVTAAKNAMIAGFDGVELHGANGYLIEQFLNPNVNERTDLYGGSIENRARFATEVAKQVSGAIGKEKVGIRLSPNSTLGDLLAYDADATQKTYAHLARELNQIGIAYVHVGVNPNVPVGTLSAIRKEFRGTLIHCNGFTSETAEAELQKGNADLIAFGRNFLANPDFVERIVAGATLNPVDFTTIYSPGEKGYVDYPTMTEKKQKIL